MNFVGHAVHMAPPAMAQPSRTVTLGKQHRLLGGIEPHVLCDALLRVCAAQVAEEGAGPLGCASHVHYTHIRTKPESNHEVTTSSCLLHGDARLWSNSMVQKYVSWRPLVIADCDWRKMRA